MPFSLESFIDFGLSDSKYHAQTDASCRPKGRQGVLAVRMLSLFEVKNIDRQFYEERLKDFLPAKIFDMHAHVYLEQFRPKTRKDPLRTVTWPQKVAKYNSIEGLIETYQLLFPGKQVSAMIFSSPSIVTNAASPENLEPANDYISQCSGRHGFPALILGLPQWSGAELEEKIVKGKFCGLKAYLNFSPTYLSRKEIRIFDFLPHHQLEVLNQHGWIVMLHVPRDDRLRDPVNLAQMIEIEKRYPQVKVIIAHVGRAYCMEDIGDAFEVLSDTEKLLFDISANTNRDVFQELIQAVGPQRILFGSDLPIVRMRMRRICENGVYINLFPKGLYGDVSGDKNMREVEHEEAQKLTFFMYEEIDAFRHACEAIQLTRQEVEDIFYNNAIKLIESVQLKSHES